MTTQEITDTLQDYYSSCNELLRLFCEKHDFDYDDAKDSWVAGDIGSIVECGDYYFDLQDIITDLKQDPHEDEIISWYDYTLRCSHLGITGCNYQSWLKGCPRYSEEDFARLEAAKKRAEQAENDFKALVTEYKNKGSKRPF